MTEPLPRHGKGWRTKRGYVGIWLPHPTLLVVVLRGHGEGALAAPILAAYARLPKTGHIHPFFDADELTNDDSPLRTELTACIMPDRPRVASLCVLVKSRLVSMGVIVANLALGGKVKTTSERAQFKGWLDACAFENHVVGFSSNVQDSFQSSAVEVRG